MKKTIVLLFILLAVAFRSYGEQLPLPWLPKVVKLRYEAINKSNGEKLWKENYTLSTGLQGERKYLLINVKGKGKFAGSDTSTRWEVNSYYYIDPSVRPCYSKKQIYSLAGMPLVTETFYYEPDSRKVYFNHENHLTGQVRGKTLNWYNDMVDRYGYPLVLLSYPFAERREVKFHYISDDPKIYSFIFSYAGLEKVVVPAGSFPAHKIKLMVDLGLLNLMQGFLPNNYYYISDTDPKIFLKYDGLEAGLGTPAVEIKLLEYPEY